MRRLFGGIFLKSDLELGKNAQTHANCQTGIPCQTNASPYADVMNLGIPWYRRRKLILAVWQYKGVKINGEFLNELRFEDDIFVYTGTQQELQYIWCYKNYPMKVGKWVGKWTSQGHN